MVVGNYGSGKTEVAVNLALYLRSLGHAVSIADLDVVNPYFRCREPQDLLLGAGIRVVVPPGNKRFADLPIVVPEIRGMVQYDSKDPGFAIFDVGGDDVGATMLSSLTEPLGARDYALLQIINSSRPFTDTVEGCLRMKTSIERASRLKINGLIVNSHLADETTPEVILKGYALAEEVSNASGVPIELVAVMGPLADAPEITALPAPIMRLERIMVPPWLDRATAKPARISAKSSLPPAV